MELKVGGLGSKWNTLLNKGATIAKEGLDFVNKQITDIRTTIHQDGSPQHDPHSLNLGHYTPSTTLEDPITSALRHHQIPVFYYCQPSICPTQCTTCHTSSVPKSHPSIPQYPQQPSINLSSSHDHDTHVFFLPVSIQSIDHLTVRQLKQLLPPSIMVSAPSNHSIHLRFKTTPLIEDQDLFTDYIWLDVDDDLNPPTFHGSIHMRILPLPVKHHSRQHPLPPHHTSSSPQLYSHHQDTQGLRSSPPSSSPPWDSSASIESNKRLDLLCSSGSNNHDTPSLRQRQPSQHRHHHQSASSDAPSTQQNEFDRARLISQREAKKEARIQEVMNEHAARREREVVDAEAKYIASEELREQLDRWALTGDGLYKDLRALLSSLPDVLWEDPQWQPVSLSELVVMRQGEFKKVYRTALLLSHPDKHQTSSPQTQFRAQRIFQALNESFKSMS